LLLENLVTLQVERQLMLLSDKFFSLSEKEVIIFIFSSHPLPHKKHSGMMETLLRLSASQPEFSLAYSDPLYGFPSDLRDTIDLNALIEN
jgi:hypothetical protein